MEGIFVTGTDTGVGKTTICAGLLKLLHGSRAVSYWKPVQTGTVIGDDTRDVKELTELESSSYLEPSYRFPEAVAPYIAARNVGQEINLETMLEFQREQRSLGKFLIVEGAGGLFVPMTKTSLQHELVREFGLPVIVVAENKLGTINQTLLTVRACRDMGSKVLGVILTKSRQAPGLGNAECISNYGDVDILAEISDHVDRKATVSDVSCDSSLRTMFGVPPLPQ